MLSVVDVTKRFNGFTAVDSLSFTAERGKMYGLIGPNGAGKSTTIRMIMNILSPDSGKIELDGKPFGAEDRNRVGYLPEERGLYKKQKLGDVLLYLAALKGCPAREARPRIDRWLDRFGLLEWKDKKVDALSKGMAQKAQFVGAVAHGPEVVFLDEPFSGLDPVSADETLAAITELKDEGTLVLFSTHVMEHAERVCDRIVMLNGGKKILDGDLREIKRSYGRNTVSVRFAASEGDFDGAGFLASLSPVARASADGDGFIAELRDGAEADSLFVALSGRKKVDSFAVTEPSLHSIFVSLARGAEGEDHARQ